MGEGGSDSVRGQDSTWNVGDEESGEEEDGEKGSQH